jgi:hypothetical protein
LDRFNLNPIDGKAFAAQDCALEAKFGQKAGLPVPKHYCLSFPYSLIVPSLQYVYRPANCGLKSISLLLNPQIDNSEAFITDTKT